MAVKVFVVDDSAVVRQALAHMLSGNAEVELIGSAPNPLLAMDMIRKNPPDVLLLDIEMPRMDGFDLLRNIRADAHLGDLPVIMITSRIAQKHREHAMQLGANHYLGKPYAEEELLALVRSYGKRAPAQPV